MASPFTKIVIGGLAIASRVFAQSGAGATNTTIPPAATTVSSSSTAAGASLFTDETVQLTDGVIASLNQSISNSSTIALFDFASNDTDATTKRSTSSCKVFPGDSAWPSNTIWEIFNLLLGGALIETVPSAASCYTSWGIYDPSRCEYVSNEWTDSYFHAEDPTSVMWPLYQGRTCLPTSENVTATCTLGGYPSYAVNVTNVAQIQLAINFARNANIRLVIKNTGHDFNGKSAGAGGLSLWTHHLKNIEYYPNYQSASYSGPAVKMGAGVQASEVYVAARDNGVTLVGGEGRSVGVGGGFMAGGGHSPLSSLWGMAADQVVAVEVVTADGRFLTATDTVNSDLFWALRGGGGSTLGVATSWIVKAHPQIGVTTSRFTFGTGANVTAENFWAGVRAFLSYFPRFADAGTYSYFWVLPGNNSYTFEMAPFFGPNLTVDGFNTLMSGWFSDLAAQNIAVEPNATYYDNFYDAWWNAFPLETVGLPTLKTASRLFPRDNFEDASLFNRTFAAIRNTTEHGHSFLSFNIAGRLSSTNTANSVNPAWRETVLHGITSTSWDANATPAEIEAASNELTYGVMDQWRATCPNAGAYMSEADISEPNFQQAFYGSNYPRLSSLKQTYDPYGLFYAPTAVGSENWVVNSVDGLPDQNGRLCRA